jgi:hypothetical protein
MFLGLVDVADSDSVSCSVGRAGIGWMLEELFKLACNNLFFFFCLCFRYVMYPYAEHVIYTIIIILPRYSYRFSIFFFFFFFWIFSAYIPFPRQPIQTKKKKPKTIFFFFKKKAMGPPSGEHQKIV